MTFDEVGYDSGDPISGSFDELTVSRSVEGNGYFVEITVSEGEFEGSVP